MYLNTFKFRTKINSGIIIPGRVVYQNILMLWNLKFRYQTQILATTTFFLVYIYIYILILQL